MSESPASAPAGLDPRGPRFGAAITSVLLLVVIVLGLTGISTLQVEGEASFGWFAYQPISGDEFGPSGFVLPYTSITDRVLDPAFLLLALVALLFLWSVLSPRTAPWGLLYRKLVQPRLKPPTELEDPRPPRFAQGVGLFVSVVGLVLQFAGVPCGLVIAAAAAFVAAFLNAVFGLCLGCQMYLLLARLGVVGRRAAA